MFKRFKDDLKRCEIYEKGRPFLRGGIWSNFLSKYPEGDWMHKRMISISNLFPDRKDGEDKRWADARLHLYKAQCNCAYWHGLFGGLYLNYLRQGVWENLIAAERAAREIRGEKDAETFAASDLNLDGIDEHIFENGNIYIAITPAQGASAAEIDLRPWNFNLTNVMTRREEAFHVEFMEKRSSENKAEGVKTIHEISRAKVEGLDKLLKFDSAPRLSFQDFIPWAVLGDAADDPKCKVIEWYGAMPAGWRIMGKGKFAGDIRLQTDEGWLMAEVTKQYKLEGPTISCMYEIKSGWPGDFGFATHFNLTLLAGHADDRYLTVNGKKLDPPYMDTTGCIPELNSIELHDKWLG
jgi:alpha-amylase